MTVEVTSRDTFDATVVEGDFVQFVNDLNLAAAAGKQFVLFTEVRPDGSTNPVALEARNITRAREVTGDSSDFIGR
jgi:hypothetical protein